MAAEFTGSEITQTHSGMLNDDRSSCCVALMLKYIRGRALRMAAGVREHVCGRICFLWRPLWMKTFYFVHMTIDWLNVHFSQDDMLTVTAHVDEIIWI